jgi:hypothetical protein
MRGVIPMNIRPATLDDLDEIMRVEKESFEDVGDEAMATREMMKKRILICNKMTPLGAKQKRAQWFWVAEKGGKIFGQMILQPTHLSPEAVQSWSHATDDGTFERTFAEDGETIFGASLSAANDAPPGIADLLLCRIGLLMFRTSKRRLMFCSRLPGLRKAMEKGMSAEEYWRKEVGASHKARDPLLRKFFEIFGPPSYNRLVPNGWPTDKDSCGYSALIAVEDPFFPLYQLVEKHGKRLGDDIDDILKSRGG